MTAAETSSFALSEEIRAAVCDAIDADPAVEPVTTTYSGVGLLAWDDGCGQLVVTPERRYRYRSDPAIEATDDEQCADQIAVAFVVTLTRCVPTPDAGGHPPTGEQLSDAHEHVLRSADVVWNACAALAKYEWQRSALSQSFIGSEGGVVAIETRFVLGLNAADWQVSC